MNGVPNWENPMATSSGGSVIDTSFSPKSSPTKQSAPRKPRRLASDRDKKVTDKHASRTTADAHDRQSAPRQPRRLPSESLEPREIVPQKVHDYLAAKYGYSSENRNFENMEINCDDNFSVGSLTYDGSIEHNQQQSSPRRPVTSDGRSHRQPHDVSPPSSMPRSCTIATETQRQLSVEEQEALLVEMAMEKSLQETNSIASISTGSYRSRDSSYMSTSNATAEEHHHHRSTADDRQSRPPSKTDGNFVWKREGKKWNKVPITRQQQRTVTSGSADAGLQAITEVEEFNESFSHFQHRTASLQQDEDCLTAEELEQQMLEEAMQQSMSSFNSSASFSSPRRSVLNQGSTCSRRSLGLGSQQDAMARRLRELEEEKAMIEQALQQGYSYTEATQRVSANQETTSLGAAGCHLAMIASSRGTRERRSSADTMGQRDGEKLVWKRGPNGAWGRFPESMNEEDDVLQREDDLVAEALKRSMEYE